MHLEGPLFALKILKIVLVVWGREMFVVFRIIIFFNCKEHFGAISRKTSPFYRYKKKPGKPSLRNISSQLMPHWVQQTFAEYLTEIFF